MSIVILGGAGFVGLNLADALLGRGIAVRLVDRAPPPPPLLGALAARPGALSLDLGDVTDPACLDAAIRPGTDAVVIAAAVTADAAREAADPGTILAVNLTALVPILEACRRAGVRRVVNLSSAAAYGSVQGEVLSEDRPAQPESLYAVTKFASEAVLARLCGHWGLDGVSVRLSAVFGPFERDTGLRDTLSPQAQIWAAAEAGTPALLPRPGRRDWLYAPDAAEAVGRLIAAERLRSRLYNVSSPAVWPVLAWGERVARARPGLVCRLVAPGETATISLHGDRDRPPLATDRLRGELGWEAAHGLEASADAFLAWQTRLREKFS
ncbi:NAD-dependent epimerase/dehydratase family protein [Methylobacterium frigidaeris]|uniref:GDP-L-fucose synthase n=1 Tax=Methylobacterium frigidaeris TaxID=2038277 RepID=A0AA37M8A1_9HYPH|nr:NAD(P)-dependent oxidoreductase [Methylobacterium frigidaeris]PIK68694.1 short-chain dehydrogenase [Methylobacterium frigidaeris]GJD65591.1 GDP-L-fucose synthase [Methylobacterium frigidaeris]